jgi:hypothetical protein
MFRYETDGVFHLFSTPTFTIYNDDDTDPRLTVGRSFAEPEAVAWCFERFGNPASIFVGDDHVPIEPPVDSRWATSPGGSILIRDLADAMEFRLRWC